MNKQLLSLLKIYVGILFFFMLDICIYNLLNQYLINSLLCYLIIKNLTNTISFNQNLFAIFFLLLGSFLHYGMYGIDLGLIIMLILIINKTRKIVIHYYLLLFIIICAYFLFKFLIIEKLILKQALNFKLILLSIVLNFLFSSVLLFINNCKKSKNKIRLNN